MSDKGAPKSAYELAMEKLKARGDYEERKLTDKQKAAIADLQGEQTRHQGAPVETTASTKPPQAQN